MRNFLRAAGRTARGFLWIVKGLLLILALATLVLWPMSCGREISLHGERYSKAADRVHDCQLLGACDNGLMVVAGDMTHYDSAGALQTQWPIPIAAGPGWKWELDSSPSEDDGRWLNSSFGPLRYERVDIGQSHFWMARRAFGLPCWLMAPLLAFWPLTSLTLVFRRHRKRRRLARAGCCNRCGYDLRATAAKTGPLLPRCPECGAAAAAGGSKRGCSATELTENTEQN